MDSFHVFYIIYTSIARTGLDHEGLTALLAQSRQNNARDGITGLLLYKNHHFMQLIEGDEAPVRALMEKIKCDERHTDILILQSGHADGRQFPGWSMAFRSPDAALSDSISEPSEIDFTSEALAAHSSQATKLLDLFEKHF